MNVFTNNNAVRRVITLWADPARPVTRANFATHLLVLATIRYLGDVVLLYTASGHFWSPADTLQTWPWSLGLQDFGRAISFEAIFVHRIWALPFAAVGLMLTARRALNAGVSPWIAILFLVPWVTHAVTLLLACLPSERLPRGWPELPEVHAPHEVRARLVAAGAGVLLAIVAVGIGVSTLRSYGGWLFILTPFLMGTCTAFVYNCGRRVTGTATNGVVLATLLAAGVVLIAVHLEGAICLVMSIPLAVPLALLGSIVGRTAATTHPDRPAGVAFMVLALPMTGAVEPATGHAVHEVRSSVIIEARPEAVWPHVVAFRDIPEPTDALFRSGIAYPIRARIDGSGVGAVRYCVFSTGAFVEPITRWEEARRLSFDVVESPPALREISPYRNVSPPHLHGYLRARRGEFRFIDLGDGRTRLEGSTWYEIEMGPEAYWRLISDALIRRIHLRVLEHIKREVEAR